MVTIFEITNVRDIDYFFSSLLKKGGRKGERSDKTGFQPLFCSPKSSP